MPQTAQRYTGALARRYQVDVPADPGWARPEEHRTDEGHLVDTSGRDEAPRGGGWMSLAYLEFQQPLPGGSPATFDRTHDRVAGHTQATGGTAGDAQGQVIARLAQRLVSPFPDRPNTPATLANAGAAGAANGGLRAEGMQPWASVGRRTVDGRQTVGSVNLGHDYALPAERRSAPLHLNRPRLRRVLAPSIARERGSVSPGGYSSQYDPSAPMRTAGVRAPHLRRLIKAEGQAEYDTVSQEPANARAAGGGPIGNGGW
jgi:hypothetical protein